MHSEIINLMKKINSVNMLYLCIMYFRSLKIFVTSSLLFVCFVTVKGVLRTKFKNLYLIFFEN